VEISLMSALGQKRTSEHVRVMSALPPKADNDRWHREVCFVPTLLELRRQLIANGYRQRNPKTRRCEKILGLDALHASDKDKVAGSRAEAPGPLRFYGAGRIEGLGADINRTPMLNP
jgi:hypothetical protein